MLDYLKVLEENKKKNKKLINVTFLTNFNNLILNNFINYFFKKRTSYKINFLKTDYDQVQQQLNNVKFRKKIIKTKFIILAIDLNIVLNFKAEKLNSYLVMFKNYLNQIINYFPNKQLLVFNLTYLESVCFYNQELKFDIQKKIISTNYYLIGLSKKTRREPRLASKTHMMKSIKDS